ncbi:hypothetical protein HKD24_14390 [Gluconobacter sp. LMG 31484]|uniref:Peptidase C39 domain-containing protein n=1 Tax=Gluconobacter vitians TaxID=2728102 RepID=A0ABR9Y9B6_9PROT|nr:hypothetical protein [Gluconobacter vitians]MBF0860371.1 hypothetical protein [Gluconobacter vitians]
MKLIKQKTETDCGVACVAMLAGVSWAKARDALNFKKSDKKFYTDKDSVRNALTRLGVITEKNFVVCKYPERLTKDALLRTNLLANGNWHWAVWDAKRQEILDPYYKRTRPLSCLIVLRRERRQV